MNSYWRAKLFHRPIKLDNFLHKLLFPGQSDHLEHLVDDVIRLERENKRLKQELVGWQVSHNYTGPLPEYKVTTNGNGKTIYMDLKIGGLV